MSITTSESPTSTGRHPVNVGHLVMGIAFLGLVGIWALIQSDVVAGGDVRWLLPVPWVLAGLAGLLAIAVSSGRRRATRNADEPEPVLPAYPVPGPESTSESTTETTETSTDDTIVIDEESR